MTDPIARLEELDKAVSCRDWRTHIPPNDLFGPQILNCHGGIIAEFTSYAKSRADAQAICAAMNSLPALIAIGKAAKDILHNNCICTCGPLPERCGRCELVAAMESLK